MYYKGAIWTNHVLERLRERGLSKDKAGNVFLHPDRRFAGKNGTTEYQKYFGKSLATLIVKQNEKKEWLILSAWIKYKDQYKKASFWGKVFLAFKRQLGM